MNYYHPKLKEIFTTTNNQQGEITPLTLDDRLIRIESKEMKSISFHQDSKKLPYQVLEGPCTTNDIDHRSFSTDTNISLGASFIPIFDGLWLQSDANISVIIDTMSSQCIHSCINVYLMTYENMKCYNDRGSMEQCGYYRRYTSNGTQYNITIGRKFGKEQLPPNYYYLILNSSVTSGMVTAQWSFNVSYTFYNATSPELDKVCTISSSNLTQNCSIDLSSYDGRCVFITTHKYFGTIPEIYSYRIIITNIYHSWNNYSIGFLITSSILGVFTVLLVVLFITFFLIRKNRYSQYKELM